MHSIHWGWTGWTRRFPCLPAWPGAGACGLPPGRDRFCVSCSQDKGRRFKSHPQGIRRRCGCVGGGAHSGGQPADPCQKLHHYAPRLLGPKEALTQEPERVRAAGYAYDNEECEDGVRCIAVPVRDYTGWAIAGISVSGPVMRMTESAFAAQKQLIRPQSTCFSVRVDRGR